MSVWIVYDNSEYHEDYDGGGIVIQNCFDSLEAANYSKELYQHDGVRELAIYSREANDEMFENMFPFAVEIDTKGCIRHAGRSSAFTYLQMKVKGRLVHKTYGHWTRYFVLANNVGEAIRKAVEVASDN